MRTLFLPQSASIPRQLRKALLFSGLHSTLRVYPCPLDRVLLSTSSYTASATAEASERDRRSPEASRPHGQNHDRNSGPDNRRTITTPLSKLPYKFETGISLFAKRTPRPFPPPFLSPPSGSFSDPLSTHHQSRDRRPKVNGELIKGCTNGDDAAFASEYFIGTNDGVGAWSARPRGHPGLWARLVLHFWATAMSEDTARPRRSDEGPFAPKPIAYLQRAYEQTREATAGPDWQGTTTATGAQLFHRLVAGAETAQAGAGAGKDDETEPLLYVVNIGDSQVMVVRPSSGEIVFKTEEQWHSFACPRQLGTNSPDTPTQNAVMDKVPIQEGDVVLAMSDGVIDNLWSHEIVENVTTSLKRWHSGEAQVGSSAGHLEEGGPMPLVAKELMLAAKTIALDPFAESPFMEHAIEEGLPREGGKLDDISVVAALCTRNHN